MKNATHITIGSPETWGALTTVHPKLGEVRGKMFLQETLGLTGMEISAGMMPPKSVFPLRHHHRTNEEVYVFLSGAGDFEVDGEIFPIGPGSVIRIAPDGVRAFRNTASTPMSYLVVQAPAGTGVGPGSSDGAGDPGLPEGWTVPRGPAP